MLKLKPENNSFIDGFKKVLKCLQLFIQEKAKEKRDLSELSWGYELPVWNNKAFETKFTKG